MANTDKHADHDYIVARQDRYIEAWQSGSVDEMMAFMCPKELQYSNFSIDKEGLSHSTVREQFAKNHTDFHDLNIKTRSIHGDKRFTAWEWIITYKAGLALDGTRLKREERPPKKVLGCTLMWWNEDDRIVRNHDYTQLRDDK